MSHNLPFRSYSRKIQLFYGKICYKVFATFMHPPNWNSDIKISKLLWNVRQRWGFVPRRSSPTIGRAFSCALVRIFPANEAATFPHQLECSHSALLRKICIYTLSDRECGQPHPRMHLAAPHYGRESRALYGSDKCIRG